MTETVSSNLREVDELPWTEVSAVYALFRPHLSNKSVLEVGALGAEGLRSWIDGGASEVVALSDSQLKLPAPIRVATDVSGQRFDFIHVANRDAAKVVLRLQDEQVSNGFAAFIDVHLKPDGWAAVASSFSEEELSRCLQSFERHFTWVEVVEQVAFQGVVLKPEGASKPVAVDSAKAHRKMLIVGRRKPPEISGLVTGLPRALASGAPSPSLSRVAGALRVARETIGSQEASLRALQARIPKLRAAIEAKMREAVGSEPETLPSGVGGASKAEDKIRELETSLAQQTLLLEARSAQHTQTVEGLRAQVLNLKAALEEESRTKREHDQDTVRQLELLVYERGARIQALELAEKTASEQKRRQEADLLVLREEISSLQASLSQDDGLRLKGEIVEFRASADREQDRLLSALSEAGSRITSLEAELASLQDEAKRSDLLCTELVEQQSLLKQQCQSKSMESDQLASSLKALRTEFSQNAAELEAAHRLLEDRQIQIRTLAAAKGEVLSQKRSVELTAAHLAEEVDRLRTKLREVLGERDALSVASAMLAQERTALEEERTQIALERDQALSKGAEPDELQKAFELASERGAELLSLKARLEQLESAQAEAEQAYGSALAQKASAEAKAVADRSRRVLVEGKLADAYSKIGEMQAHTTAIEYYVGTLKEGLSDSKGKRSELESLLLDTIEAHCELEDRLSAAESALQEAERSKAEAERSKAEAERSKAEAISRYEELEEEKRGWAQVSELRPEEKRGWAQVSELHPPFDEALVVQDLQSRLQDADDRNRSLSLEVEDLQATQQAFRTRIDALEAQLALSRHDLAEETPFVMPWGVYEPFEVLAGGFSSAHAVPEDRWALVGRLDDLKTSLQLASFRREELESDNAQLRFRVEGESQISSYPDQPQTEIVHQTLEEEGVDSVRVQAHQEAAEALRDRCMASEAENETISSLLQRSKQEVVILRLTVDALRAAPSQDEWQLLEFRLRSTEERADSAERLSQELREKVKSQAETLARLRIVEDKARIASLEKEEAVSALEDRLEAGRTLVLRLKAQLVEAKSDLSELKDAQQKERAELKTLRARVNVQREDQVTRSALRGRVDELEAKRAEEQKRNEAEQQTLQARAEQAEQALSVLRQRIDNSSQERSKLVAELERANASNTAARFALKEAERKVELAQQARLQFQQQLNSLQSRQAASEGESSKAAAAAEQARSVQEELREDLKRMQQQKRDAEAQVSEAQALALASEAELERVKSELERQQKVMSAAQARCEALEAELSIAKATPVATPIEVVAAQRSSERVQALQKELASAEGRVAHLDRARLEAEQRAEEAEQLAKQADRELSQAVAAAESVKLSQASEVRIAALESSIQGAKEAAKEAEKTSLRLKAERDQAVLSSRTLQARLSEAEARQDARDLQYAELQQKVRRMEASFDGQGQSDLDEVRAELGRKIEAFRNLTEERDALFARFQKTESELHDLKMSPDGRAHREQLEKEIAAHEAELERLRSELDTSSQERFRMRRIMQGSEEVQTQLERRVSELENELDRTEAQRKQLELEIDRLRGLA